MDYLEKRHKGKKLELESLRGDYRNRIIEIQAKNKKIINEKNKMIKNLSLELNTLKEEFDLYENKLNVIPAFIVKKYNKV